MASVPDPNEYSSTVEAKFDQLLALLRIAHAPALTAARIELQKNPSKAAALDAAEDWIQAGALRKKVAAASGAADSTVRGAVADLLEAGLLVRRYGGPKTEYKTSGVL